MAYLFLVRAQHPCATRESASTALVVWPRLHHHGAGGVILCFLWPRSAAGR
jgi:hypothetical protein